MIVRTLDLCFHSFVACNFGKEFAIFNQFLRNGSTNIAAWQLKFYRERLQRFTNNRDVRTVIWLRVELKEIRVHAFSALCSLALEYKLENCRQVFLVKPN